MAPKTKVVLHSKENTVPPSDRRNPALPAPESSRIPANSTSLQVAAVFGLSTRKSAHTSVRNSFEALQEDPMPHHQQPTAIPAVVVQEEGESCDSGDESEQNNAENESENSAAVSADSGSDGSENSADNGSHEGSNGDADDAEENDVDDAENCSSDGDEVSAEEEDDELSIDGDNDSLKGAPESCKVGCKNCRENSVEKPVSGALIPAVPAKISAANMAAVAGNAHPQIPSNAAGKSGTGSATMMSSLPPTDVAVAEANLPLRRSISVPSYASFSARTDEIWSDSEQENDVVQRGAEPVSDVQTDAELAEAEHDVVAGNSAPRSAVAEPSNAVGMGAAEPSNAAETGAVQTGKSAANSGISEPVAAVAGLDAATNPIDATENDVGGRLDFVPVNIEEGKLLIAPKDDDISRCKKKWHECLVGYFVGSSLPENVVKEYAHRMWGKKGLIGTFVTSKRFFFFRFDSENARKKVLETGPHFMFKHPIVLQQYEKKMRLVKERQKKIAIWVKFFDIPVELMSYRGISLVASAVGKPLYLDEATKKMVTSSVDRFTFARVCVEADAERPLPNEMYVDFGDGDEHIKIEAKYDWRPPHCSKCKVFGHSCDKRTSEKNVGLSYADMAAKSATPCGESEAWPALATPQQPSAQQNQSCGAANQPPQHGSARPQQQHTATSTGQQRTSSGQQCSAANSGQQQSSALQATRQQKSASPAPPQTSAQQQNGSQQPPVPLRSSAQQQNRSQQTPASLQGPVQQQNCSQQLATRPEAPQQPAERPQQLQDHPRQISGQQQEHLQQQISGQQYSTQLGVENGENKDGNWQKAKGKGRGRGRGRGRGNAMHKEGPTTRSSSRVRVA